MSKFANRNHKELKLDDKLEDSSSIERKGKTSSELRKHLELTRSNRSKTETSPTERNFTRTEQNPAPSDTKPSVAESEASSSEVLHSDRQLTTAANRELAIEEESEICREEYISDNDFSERSLDKSLDSETETDLWIEAGLKLYQNEKYLESIDTLQKSLNRESKNVLVNYWLGMNYYQLSKIDSAVEHFIVACPSEDNPFGYVEAFFWLGEVYRQQGKIQQAKNNYQKLLSLAPNSTYSSLALEQLSAIKFDLLFG